MGPINFITSVEVSKTQSNERENAANRTIVITGGQGSEEYKTVTGKDTATNQNFILSDINQQNVNSTNFSVSNTTNNTLIQALNNNNNINNNNPNTYSNTNFQPQNQPYYFSTFNSADDTNIGKEDLINYVLTWEI